MQTLVANGIQSNRSGAGVRLAAGSAGATLLLLASLHILSPEFDPSWRMVSEYANGRYGWVLSLMFVAWAGSSWALGLTLWPKVESRAGKIGVCFLMGSGLGEAMASMFDINHPLHDLAGAIGVLSLPIAAMLISVSLSRAEPWSAVRKELLWTANLTWISVVLMIVSLIAMFVTYSQAGGHIPADGKSLPLGTALPPRVIALAGYADRLLIVVYCVWVMTAAWQAIRLEACRS